MILIEIILIGLLGFVWEFEWEDFEKGEGMSEKIEGFKRGGCGFFHNTKSLQFEEIKISIE